MAKWLRRCAGLVGLSTVAVVAWVQLTPPPPEDHATVVERVREVARLEALDVAVYTRVTFEPDPAPSATLLGDLAEYARFTVAPPRGRALVFGDAHLGLDHAQLDARHVRVRGDRVEVVLPPVQVQVSLRPEETEVLGSNLDSAQTAQLLALGRARLERQVRGDRALHQRARASAERALRGLLLTLGFREVVFVDAAPTLRS